MFEVIADQSSWVPEGTVEEQKMNGVDDALSGEEIPDSETPCKKAARRKAGETIPPRQGFWFGGWCLVCFIFCLFCVLLFDTTSLSSPGWPRTLNPPSSASQVAGMCHHTWLLSPSFHFGFLFPFVNPHQADSSTYWNW